MMKNAKKDPEDTDGATLSEDEFIFVITNTWKFKEISDFDLREAWGRLCKRGTDQTPPPATLTINQIKQGVSKGALDSNMERIDIIAKKWDAFCCVATRTVAARIMSSLFPITIKPFPKRVLLRSVRHACSGDRLGVEVDTPYLIRQ